MSTFVLVGTSVDFTTDDLEDLIYKDIGDKWGLVATDLTKERIFGTTTKADMINQPFQGFRPHWIWVQHKRTFASRTSQGSSMGRQGHIAHQSTFLINIFSRRLTKPGLTFPELGQIAREVERILFQYPLSTPWEITGIESFDNWIMENVNEANNLGESFGGVYRLVCAIDAKYWKMSTV